MELTSWSMARSRRKTGHMDGDAVMERTSIVFAERSGKRDAYFFLLGAWSVMLPQILRVLF
jgi:hypothetical protein